MSEILPIQAKFIAGPPSLAVPDADLALINASSASPFGADDIAIFACVMATQGLTTYATKLGTSSLINFAADAAAGTPYLLDHNPDGGVYGYTYAGQYDPAKGEARAAVFLPRGRRPAGYGSKTSDQEIADIAAGMRRSVSVGFGGALTEWQCDICGNDVFSVDCEHLPGMKFDGQLATATVENAHLLELSGVFQGACPGAVIGKAEQMYSASRFGSHQFRGWLDQMEIPDPTKFTSTRIMALKETPSPGKENTPMREKLASALATCGLTTMAALVLGAQSDDLDVLAKNLSAQVGEEVRAQIAKDPMRTALAAAEITHPDQLTAMKADAAKWQGVAAAKRTEAKANATLAYAAKPAELSAALEDIEATADGPAFDRLCARLDADAPAKEGAKAQTRPVEMGTVATFATDDRQAPAQPQPVAADIYTSRKKAAPTK
jgi:hypothetical protein